MKVRKKVLCCNSCIKTNERLWGKNPQSFYFVYKHLKMTEKVVMIMAFYNEVNDYIHNRTRVV